MKDYVVKEIDRFLEITEGRETPLKFYQVNGEDVRVECNLRVLMISFEGKKTENLVQRLRSGGFVEVDIRETRPMVEM